MECGFTEQFSARLRWSLIEGGCRRAHRALDRKLPNAQDDFSHQLVSGHPIHLFQEHRFEEGELLEPHRIMHVDVKLFKTDLVGTRVRGDRFTHDVGPMTSQARFEEFALQAQSMGHTC